ncbi:hypothetical protein ANN_06122 [Periplaneta americana]|uniref:Protein CLEC16A n=1 Tax=Periplaneta americana TaxID=6978 RepID=A0ABQ8TF47_PERAM|nr:hypothetical protein ANN_06122 [Periplaneta americana]
MAGLCEGGNEPPGSLKASNFFLEKNMLSFFLKIMKQKCGSYVCVQLLQTLNILFENIRNETSLYYLLSNNHVNSIIVHKFDFSDEEVMAYYISFLKTLSLKLNAHTIHFFYNEHTNDFPLYTEAIKFFNHPESMVRIAVRTLTLNVYKVEDKSMLKFIRDKTAAPYFSNLVWFIGNHILELDTCVRNDADHQSQNRLSDLVAEHLDHLHYLNDILSLDIGDLNQVLTDHLLNKLLIPLYVYSLTKRRRHSQLEDTKPHVSSVVSLFLLSQVFLIITHVPLVHVLASIILTGDMDIFSQGACEKLASHSVTQGAAIKPGFVAPTETLEKSLERDSEAADVESGAVSDSVESKEANLNITDEEKEQRLALGVNRDLLDGILFLSEKASTKHWYNTLLAEKLIRIISTSCQPNCRVRLVTLELSIRLLTQLVMKNGQSYLHDAHLAAIEGAKEESTCLLRNFYKSEEIFLDMFEDEYSEMQKRPLNVEWLMMDSNILLPPTGTPMTGIEFNKRLPCGEVERARRAIRVFFLIRELSLMLAMESETQLPLTNPQSCVQVNNVLDLNNSDLIACTVANKEGSKIRRFLVMDVIQLILVEPDTRRLGWGVAKFVGFLQDIEVTGDKDDSRCLHITIHRPLSSGSSANRVPLLSARFIFDDHIRCMAAKQRLTKGRIKARQKKMHMIARLLDLPSNVQPCPSPPAYTVLTRHSDGTSSNLFAVRENSQGAPQGGPASSRLAREPGHHRPLFTANNKVPGFATVAMRRESMPPLGRLASPSKRRSDSQGADRSDYRPRPASCTINTPAQSATGSIASERLARSGHVVRSREGSPRLPRPRSEEIPLEDMGTKHKPRNGGTVTPTPPEVASGPAQFPLKRPSFPYSAVPVGTPDPTPAVVVPTQEPSAIAAAANTEKPPAPPSEETSFTQLPSENGVLEKEERKTRRRGMVETV